MKCKSRCCDYVDLSEIQILDKYPWITKFKKPAHTSVLIGGTKTAFLFSRVGIGNAACLLLLYYDVLLTDTVQNPVLQNRYKRPTV